MWQDTGRLCLFPNYLPIGNQAFSYDWCNIGSGLSYNKANNTFLNSIRKNEVEAQIEFTLKVYGKEGVSCYWCNSVRIGEVVKW